MILKSVRGYRVRWREGTTQRQQWVATKEEARRLEAQKVLKRRGGQGRGRSETPFNVSVKDYAEHWLDREKLRVAPKTYASFAETIKRYVVKPGVGSPACACVTWSERISRRCFSRPAPSLAPGLCPRTRCESFGPRARCSSKPR